jgi:hypothetical protein
MESPQQRAGYLLVNVKHDVLVKVYKAFRNDTPINFLVTGISVILSVAKYKKI